MHHEQMVLMTARQLASGLIRAIIAARQLSTRQINELRIPEAMLHFHDSSSSEIAWNDVQAIQMYNQATGRKIPVPLVASEGYNRHGHTSDYDGGYIPTSGPHDHRDNYHGGFCFAVYHPGTGLPQQPWAV